MRIDLKGKIICCKGVLIISLAASLCFVFGHDTLRFQCFFSPRRINGKKLMLERALGPRADFLPYNPGSVTFVVILIQHLYVL